MEKGFDKKVKKVWGMEHWLVNTELYCAKVLVIAPGGHSSLHYHLKKDETFIVCEGECWLQMGEDGVLYHLTEDDKVRITPNTLHRFWVGLDSSPCKILEISTHHEDEDVVRLEESRIEIKEGGKPA